MALTLCGTTRAETPSFERNLSDALRLAHDRGAELFNDGDRAACFRMFQGALIVAQSVLVDHPSIQKLIINGLADADREPDIAKKGLKLHEVIERVRTEIKASTKKGAEALAVPPREVVIEAKPKVKPPDVKEAMAGVVGRVYWQNQPVDGMEVMFVTLDRVLPRTYEAVTGAQGVYTVPDLPPGKYVITIVPGPKATTKKISERYATTATSTLRFDVKAGGEKLDFLLQ